MTFLLDVNVLIALADPAHVSHDAAHDWFKAAGSDAFATCPLTQNGFVRIVGHPAYPNSPGSPAAAMATLHTLCALPGHRFWPDDISLRDAALFVPDALLTAARVTDSYLLGLAVAHGGRLATLDRRLSAAAVKGGAVALYVIGKARS